ncbi:MAG: aminotransferase class III-fold pyridoxal phosphate-dependent enzyme [Actinomycetota bacterium]
MEASTPSGSRSRVLTAAPPRFTSADAEAVARRVFGVEGRGSELGSERDQNFRIEDASGPSYVLKISNSGEDRAVLEMETGAILHAAGADPELPLPEPLPATDGTFMSEVEGPDGSRHLVRLLTFLDGYDVDAPDVPASALYELGRTAARMGRALRGFFHPAAGRELLWDAKNLPNLRPMLEHVGAERREVVRGVLDRFETNVAPVLGTLRAQLVHGDLSLGNVLVDRQGNVTGIVDFGDMTHTALACDLTAALASFVRGRTDAVESLASVLAGYGSVTPIEPEEAAILSDLLLGRLCTTLLVSAWRVRQYPENAEYIQAWDPHSWQLLATLDDIGFDRATELVRGLCGPSAAAISLPPQDDDVTLLERRRRVLGGELGELSYARPLHLVRGAGTRMYDADGNAYLDAYNNVPVVGHSHPRVVAAIAEQARRLNTNTRYLHENVVTLAERLTASMPEELDTCVFVNSGSEANDAAMRFALRVTGNTGAIVTRFAYHGVSIAIGDLSPEEWPGGRQPPHVETIPAPSETSADWTQRASADMERAIAALAERGVEPAVVMIDTGYTSDGVFAPPPAYLREIVERTHAAGALFVADEVQAGYGRCGVNLWSFQDSGVVPDFVTLGKPMGNGHPVAATVMRREIAERYARGEAFFSTFGGNPVACAAALAVLDVLRDEDLVRNTAEIGAHLRASLLRLRERFPLVADVRGRGLLIGVELAEEGRPAAEAAAAVSNGMRERGVLIGTTGPDGNALKIRPPLVVSREDADTIAATLEETLSRVAE